MSLETRIDAAPGAFARRFQLEACSVSLAGATKEECLRELAGLLAQSGQVDERLLPALHAEFLARERLASTGIGGGVAIPHVKLAGQRTVALALAVHRPGVAWAAVDGDPAHIFFAVVRPAGASAVHDPKRHLELLHWIARLARASDFRRFALAAATRAELLELLAESPPA